MSEYVEVNNVRMGQVLPSGKSFSIVSGSGWTVVVPVFAVHADSEIWKGSSEGDLGSLVLRQDIAIQKGLSDAPSRSLGGGIPLKRHRLPEPVVLMDKKRLTGIQDRLRLTSHNDYNEWSCWGGELISTGAEEEDKEGSDRTLAVFEEESDAEFVAEAPRDIQALLDENRRLRDWVAEVTKKRARR